ncbi:unnamed protein product [Lactuca virosa]|uniref:B box-type domain-containing protein n=1 Tax=Lactuca virosa TaxID=75947 RepID=A0AAU9NC86_9ASTR|nr:unnamed protein product [Lactuca virosa]
MTTTTVSATTTTTTTTTATAATAASATGGNGTRGLRNQTQVPPWVLVMINIQYNGCMIHSNAKDNKLDRFCIDCGASFCNKCSSNHHGHKSIKIRRYVYHDVINRPDAQKHFDCSGIQGYVTNRAKVLFLKQRRDDQQPVKEQHQNTRSHNCIICKRSLPDSRYCSIQCKVSAMYNTGNMEEAGVDKNVSRKKGEESEKNLYDAMEAQAPTKLMPSKRKRLRKGFPHKAPLF